MVLIGDQHTRSMEGDERSDKKFRHLSPHWMAAHARLKNEFREDEKYQKTIRIKASLWNGQ